MTLSVKKQVIADAQYHLWRGTSHGEHTTSQCCREGCENSARGGSVCVACAEKDLATAVGKALAREYVLAIRNIRRIEKLLK
jgi:hypothetical protein